MDNNFFARVGSAMRSMRMALAQNEQVRRLLILSTPGSSVVTPPISQALDHIFIQPIVDIETNPPFNKQAFITITLPELNKNNLRAEMQILMRVSCFVDKPLWIYGDSNQRALMLSGAIVDTLNEHKVAFAGPLLYDSTLETVTNSNLFGYINIFTAVDGVGVPYEGS